MHQPPDRADHGALCDLLTDELWVAFTKAIPAATPDDVMLACLGEVVIRAVAMAAHRKGMPSGAMLRLLCGGMLAAEIEKAEN